MNYKIASLVLNAGKAQNTINRVFIAQPDALKENLAGRLFVLAEINGKRAEAEKILSFIINTINTDYYGDEKILLRQKVDTIKVENIFESVLTKTNKSLVDFINEEKIKISQYSANLVVGVVYENKLYFSNLGKNKALLIYPRQDHFAVSNVESGSEDDEPKKQKGGLVNEPKFFSSVVSGEIPPDSYFIFANEALPEYLSPKELTNIVTKLPPIVAAEQIKNTLSQINSYVPFLGIIIKNSFGSDLMDSGIYVRSVSAQSSISNLNYTEEKTEKMLSPAGLINLRKASQNLRAKIQQMSTGRPSRKQLKLIMKRPADANENKDEQVSTPIVRPTEHKETFLAKGSISGRKKKLIILTPIKNTLQGFILLFSGPAIKQIGKNIKTSFIGLNKHRRILVGALSIFVIIFVASLIYTNINRQQEASQEKFNSLVAQIESKQDQIDSYLLYNNEEGARQVLLGLEEMLASFPQKSKQEKEKFQILVSRLEEVKQRVQRLETADTGQELLDLASLSPQAQPSGLFFFNDRLYISDNAKHELYSLQPQNNSGESIPLANTSSINNPSVSNNEIYYQDQGQIVKIDTNNKTGELININREGIEGEIIDYQIFNTALYVLTDKQIYRLNRSGTSFTGASPWLKEDINLSGASTMFIDGNIYILKTDGSLLKLFKGQKQDYQLGGVIPALKDAKQLMVGDNNLYIFDKESKRLAIFAKNNGKFNKQFDFSNFNDLRDIAVNEKTKNAYILTGNKIHSVSLDY